MTLLKHYQRLLASGEILEDTQQRLVIQKLQALYEALTRPENFLSRFARTYIKGLYLWGSVGIGKTFLMDTFYHSLPFEDKWRTHFLPFMHEVHVALNSRQGTKNPLKEIAKHWAKKTRVICFDELVINDIADALMLERLLDAFFTQKICMVFTSNVAPENLYKNGIQRELFLPAIEKIQQYNDIMQLSATEDYRTRYPGGTKYYWSPLTTTTQQQLEQMFIACTKDHPYSTLPLVIYEREIRIKKMAGDVVWFDFSDICGVPRNQDDYLIIAQKFRTVFMSNLSPIRAHENDLARSFIQLIDVFYDQKIRLVISAALPIEHIYTEGKLLFEFARTKSRVIQMQSETWWQEKRSVV